MSATYVDRNRFYLVEALKGVMLYDIGDRDVAECTNALLNVDLELSCEDYFGELVLICRGYEG